MTRKQFKKLADKMVEIYGVNSYQSNLNDDPEDDINDELWFACPECGEPIMWDDVNEVWSECLEQNICPICDAEWEVE